MRINAVEGLESFGLSAGCIVILKQQKSDISTCTTNCSSWKYEIASAIGHVVEHVNKMWTYFLTLTMMARFCPFSSKLTSLIPSSSTYGEMTQMLLIFLEKPLFTAVRGLRSYWSHYSRLNLFWWCIVLLAIARVKSMDRTAASRSWWKVSALKSRCLDLDLREWSMVVVCF